MVLSVSRSHIPKSILNQTGRIRDDEDINPDGALTEAQLAEMVRQRQTHTNLQILEMVCTEGIE